MISLHVTNSHTGRDKILDKITRKATQRVGYQAVNYHGCVYRVIQDARTPRIDTAEPIRCRGEIWEKPTGRERRESCAGFKRDYKLARLHNQRSEAAWKLSRARWLRCPWLRSMRKKKS